MAEYERNEELLQRISRLEDRLERIETFISGLSEVETPTKAQSAHIASKRIEAFVEDSKSDTASMQTTLDGISSALAQAHSVTSSARGDGAQVDQELVGRESEQPSVMADESEVASVHSTSQAPSVASSDVTNASEGDVSGDVATQRKASAFEKIKNFDPSSSMSKTLENKIGSNFMGVLASILIFIGIVSLAILIYPNLTREIRFVLMFVISIGITVAGGLLYRRKANAFSISLFACGISTIYISLIITWAYFKYLTLHGVYITILVWGVGVCLITRKLQSYVFRIIYYIGITVAVLFGARFVEEQGDVIFLVFFQIIALATNIFLQLKDKTAKDDYTDAGFIVGLSMVQLAIPLDGSWLYDRMWLGVFWAWIVLVRFVMITAFEMVMLYLTYRNAKYQKYYHGEDARIKIGYVASIYIIGILVQQVLMYLGMYHSYAAYYGGGLESTFMTVVVSLWLMFIVSSADRLCGLHGESRGEMKLVNAMIVALLAIGTLLIWLDGFDRKWTYLAGLSNQELSSGVYLFICVIIYLGFIVPSIVAVYKNLNRAGLLNKILYVLLWIYLTKVVFEFDYDFGMFANIRDMSSVISMLLAIILSYAIFRKCTDITSHRVSIVVISLAYWLLFIEEHHLVQLNRNTGHLFIYSIFALLASLYHRLHDRKIVVRYMYASIAWLYVHMFRVAWLYMYSAGPGLVLLLLLLGAVVVTFVIPRTRQMEQTINKFMAAAFIVPLLLSFIRRLCLLSDVNYFTDRAGYIVGLLAGLIWLAVVMGSYSRVWNEPKDVLRRNGPVDMTIMRTAIYMQEVLVLLLFLLPSLTGVYYRTFYGGRLLDMHILIVVESLAISCASIRFHKLYINNKPAMNVWFGIKLTAGILGTVFSFIPYGQHTILASIICLICALAAVGVGFVVRYKEVRLYGLALSMLSIAKLVLVDINYRNSMSRVVGFIFAGLICFGISFLYNKLAQNFVDEETGGVVRSE